MTEQQNVIRQEMHTPLIGPQLYLSSAGAGWEGLHAQAFHEPAELEHWVSPGLSDIILILFTGGAMHLEMRYVGDPWQGFYVRHGDLLLRTGKGVSSEARWKSLASTPTQTLHLHLDRGLFARTTEEVTGRDPTRLALVERSGFQDPLLAQIGFALWQELEQPSLAGNLYAQTAAQMLAVHLLRQYTEVGGDIKDPSHALSPQQMKRVVGYIQAHLAQEISLESLAQQTGYSPYHFARLLRRTTGESPHHFVLHWRIEQAQILLKQKRMSLAEIADACGFADQSHFTQVFKRRLGLTPRVYQQKQ